MVKLFKIPEKIIFLAYCSRLVNVYISLFLAVQFKAFTIYVNAAICYAFSVIQNFLLCVKRVIKSNAHFG